MPFVFQRRLAVPLWAIAFFIVAGRCARGRSERSQSVAIAHPVYALDAVNSNVRAR